jgi:hypothetical protein
LQHRCCHCLLYHRPIAVPSSPCWLPCVQSSLLLSYIACSRE